MSSKVTLTEPTATPGLDAPVQVNNSTVSVPEVFVRGTSVDEVQIPQKVLFDETTIDTGTKESRRESSNEDTFSGESWRNGDDDTCTGDDSITRPLKREYQGYYSKKQVSLLTIHSACFRGNARECHRSHTFSSNTMFISVYFSLFYTKCLARSPKVFRTPNIRKSRSPKVCRTPNIRKSRIPKVSCEVSCQIGLMADSKNLIK